MEETTNRGVWLALLVHVFFFGALGVFVLAELLREEEPEPLHVFEMVAAPAEAPPRPQPPEPVSGEEARPVEVPLMEELPLPEVEVRPRPAPPEPEPIPEPEPVPEPEPAPEPEPEPEFEQITREEFERRFGKPEPTREPQRRPARPQVDAPRLDTSTIRSALESIVVETPQTRTAPSTSARDQRALYDYIARLRAQIEARWQPPAATAGRGLEVVIRLAVAPDGRISRARVLQSSGNEVFDASALRAARSVPGVGQTPKGIPYTFDQPFSQRE